MEVGDINGHKKIVETVMTINLDHVQTIEPIWNATLCAFNGTHFQMRENVVADVSESYEDVIKLIRHQYGKTSV